MNWYQGNIAEAVAKSKATNAVFVVFIEGSSDDVGTKKLKDLINDERIRTQLESDAFVAINIEHTSTSYTQFASIYKVVPVPSLFFIGKSGSPIEIATGVISNAEELILKIDNVLVAAGKSAVPSPAVAPTSSTTNETPVEQVAVDELICEGDVCYKKNTDSASTTVAQAEEKVKATASAEAVNSSLEETRKLLEQQRRERVEKEKQLEKERELRRRREGKDVQSLQQWQKETELKELKENIKREKLEEQALRDRIKAQIAGDRAERAQKFAADAEAAGKKSSPIVRAEQPPIGVNAADTTRLQFRFGNGDVRTSNFKTADQLSVVKEYVKKELLTGRGFNDFTLASIYPKREFNSENELQTLMDLGLYPSAVLLVIAKVRITPAAIIMRSGGLVNLLSTVVYAILSPVFAVFGYFKDLATRQTSKTNIDIGAQKRANEEDDVGKQDAAKRRNLDLLAGPSTSKEAANAVTASRNSSEQQVYRRYGSSNVHRLGDNRKDSDDENATWNGNSTQQQ